MEREVKGKVNPWLAKMSNEWLYNEYFNTSVDMKCDASSDGYKAK